MAKIKRVGVWPVGLVGGATVETPIIDSHTGKTSFYCLQKRIFFIMMAKAFQTYAVIKIMQNTFEFFVW